MTEVKFIEEIIDLYQKARPSKYPNNNIFRGMSRIISSFVEDLLAYYLAKKFEDKSITIYIDQNFTVNKKSFRPDIAIVKDSTVLAVIDVKQDLGWIRTMHEKVETYEDKIKSIKGCSACLTNKYDNAKNLNVTISEDIIRSFVVISDKNVPKKRQDLNIEAFSRLKRNKLFFLTTSTHPNSYQYTRDTICKKVEINYGAFNELNELLLISIDGMPSIRKA